MVRGVEAPSLTPLLELVISLPDASPGGKLFRIPTFAVMTGEMIILYGKEGVAPLLNAPSKFHFLQNAYVIPHPLPPLQSVI